MKFSQDLFRYIFVVVIVFFAHIAKPFTAANGSRGRVVATESAPANQMKPKSSQFSIDEVKLIRQELFGHVLAQVVNQTSNDTSSLSLSSSSLSPLPSRRRGSTTSRPNLAPRSSSSSGADPSCGSNLTISSLPQVIISPNFPNKYPPNTLCEWRIRTENDKQVIKMKILDMEIEEDLDDCKYDYLDVKFTKKLCGNQMSGKEFRINNTQMTLVFKSDANYEEKGFRIQLVAETPGCVNSIKVGASGSGFIASPNYPQNYPDVTDCWTQIIADEKEFGGDNVTITLTFDVLDLEPDASCSYDYVEVFDTPADQQRLGKSLGKFCDLVAGPSFSSRTESKPTNRLRSSSGPTSDQPRVIVQSTSRSLTLHFHSDQLLNSIGYHAQYSVSSDLNRRFYSSKKCGWSITNETIASPNWPSQYPPSLDCTVTIRAPRKDQRVVIIFDTFQLESDTNCSFDRIEIYEDSSQFARGISIVDNPMMRTLCGRKSAKFKFVSRGSLIRVRFISDDFAEYAGFVGRISYTAQDLSSTTTILPPHVTGFEVSPKNATVEIGSSHLLTCIPKNPILPGTVVKWYLDDQIILDKVDDDGTRLLIRDFTAKSAGRYTCKYEKLIASAWLKARDSRCQILFRKRPRDLVLSEGEFSIMECNVVATPNNGDHKVDIIWEKDGQRINSSSRVELLSNGFLVLSGARYEDSGYYFCTAKIVNLDGKSKGEPCQATTGAYIRVNHRVNVDDVCGRPTVGQPTSAKPTVDRHGKIVGGSESQKGAFPWQAMFWDWRRRSFCGGALVNERWVVTAAHCFDQNAGHGGPPPPDTAIEVRFGKYDQSIAEDHEFNTKVMEVIKHPDFNRETFDNDIALVRLADHVMFTEHIKPVCIGDNKKEIETEFFSPQHLRLGHVTGWGQLKEHGPQPRFLQELRMPIVASDICKESTTFKVTTNMFCAGFAQELIGDACKGDSGGPFVAQHNSRFYLLGVVSWGEGCGRQGKYGFYSKVPNYMDWIKAIIKL